MNCKCGAEDPKEDHFRPTGMCKWKDDYMTRLGDSLTKNLPPPPAMDLTTLRLREVEALESIAKSLGQIVDRPLY